MSNSEKIGGVGKIIKVGESKFGKRKSTMKHPLDEQQVLGGIEQGSGKFFLVVVDDKSAKTMKEIIEEWVEPGTQIHSDSWKARDSLGEKWYQHLTVNHNVNFMESDSSICPNTFESNLKHVKNSLPAFSL